MPPYRRSHAGFACTYDCTEIYPPKGKAKRSQWGPLDSHSILYVIGEPKLGLAKYYGISASLELSKTFVS